MTHSTITWFSSQLIPTQKDEQFLLAIQSDEEIRPYPDLLWYDKFADKFVSQERFKDFYRHEIKYWAYVPLILEDHSEKLDKS